MQPLSIAYLTQFYPPDLSACSFRAGALVQALLDRLPVGSHLTVFTTHPHRYQSFSASVSENEEDDRLTIHRALLPNCDSGMLGQARSYLSFMTHIRKHVRKSRFDLVFATSSKLFSATMGAVMAHFHARHLYLDIRDIFPDTIDSLLPKPAGWMLFPFLRMIERATVRRATRLNLVSEGFRSYYLPIVQEEKLRFFRNGIDPEFLGMRPPEPGASPLLHVLYAGNMGDGQGLHRIVPELASALKGTVRFTLVGDGARRKLLETQLCGLENVEILPPVNRERLVELYNASDILFLHLNDCAAFDRVLPSKIFEYAATGRPIWAGVAGYPKKFLETEVPGTAIFPPCNAERGLAAFSMLPAGGVDRSVFIENFRRDRIMGAMADDIINACVTMAQPAICQ